VIPQKETIPPGRLSVTGQVGDDAGITEWAVVRKIDCGFQPGRHKRIPFNVRIKKRYEYSSETLMMIIIVCFLESISLTIGQTPNTRAKSAKRSRGSA
jgi:hypothetical protein